MTTRQGPRLWSTCWLLGVLSMLAASASEPSVWADAPTRRSPVAPRAATPRPSVSVVVREPALAGDERVRAEGLYERLCVACHGATGDGDGPLAMYLTVAPRSFLREPYKWRSTRSGSRPTVDDVAETIARGVAGELMPSFRASMSADDRILLARYVRSLGPRGGEAAPSPLAGVARDERELGDAARGAHEYERLQCASCHGATLRGDGPAAAAMPSARPYDLTVVAPRGGSSESAIARALRTGLDGTAMPSYDALLTPQGARDLAAFVRARVAREPTRVSPRAMVNAEPPPPSLDARTPAPSGLLHDPLRVELERAHWVFPLAPQGEGPAGLSPVERSLSPDRCGRCHATQYAQWRGSIHANAMGPGVLGQLVDMGAREANSCQICHAPLFEQSPHRADAAVSSEGSGAMMAPVHAREASAGPAPNPAFDAELRAQGVTCSVCHLRGRVRMGPPSHGGEHPQRIAGLAYPLTRLSRFERGDFCAPCHQHTPADAIHGRPVLDTVREWAFGPAFARGVQCQHCHMADRGHEWRGAHDVDAVRQAVHVAARIERVPDRDALRAVVTVENVGAGHSFPGTATPAAVLELEWLGAGGARVGAIHREVFQRHLEFDGQRLVETFDTRIASGASRAVSIEARHGTVQALRYTLTFRPDDYYEGFYRREATASWRSAQGRALLVEALHRAERSPFVVRSDTVPVVP